MNSDSYYKGIIHAHSTFSHDATDELEVWAETLTREGLNFVFLTEHVEDLTQSTFTEYVEACRLNSTEHRLIIPGLEYTFEADDSRIEVLLFGRDAYVDANCLRQLWEHKDRYNIITALPHPGKFDRISTEVLQQVDLVEVWNLRFDGGYFFSRSNFLLYEKLKNERDVFAICGVDYHVPGDRLDLLIMVEKNLPFSEENLINALRSGAFCSCYGRLLISAKIEVSLLRCILRWSIRWGRRSVYHLGRSVIDHAFIQTFLSKEMRSRIGRLIR